MDRCEHMYYKPEEKKFSYPYLYCKLTDKRCVYSKKCGKTYRYEPIEDAWRQCFMMIEEKRKSIPKDSFYVQTFRPNKRGNLYLYVVIDNKVVRILSDLTTLNQNYVYLKENGVKYEVSLTPFPKKEVKKVVEPIEIESKEIEQKPKKRQSKKDIDEENMGS